MGSEFSIRRSEDRGKVSIPDWWVVTTLERYTARGRGVTYFTNSLPHPSAARFSTQNVLCFECTTQCPSRRKTADATP